MPRRVNGHAAWQESCPVPRHPLSDAPGRRCSETAGVLPAAPWFPVGPAFTYSQDHGMDVPRLTEPPATLEGT